nr:hypothetical protein [uncultured Psychroserpens sp.]
MKLTRTLFYCMLLVCACMTCSSPDTNYLQSANELIDNDDGDGNGGVDSNAFTINEQLQPYYDRFIEEMLDRGEDLRDIPINVLLVSQSEESQQFGYCGLGYRYYNGTENAHVEIVYNGNCWIDLTDIERENLMFHEFGHALLARPHKGDPPTFPNGSARSLMCSSVYCYAFHIYTNYQETQRSFYLDELLDETINTPSWAGEKFYNTTIDNDQISEDANGWFSETSFQDDNPINPYNYFIDNTEFASPPYALAVTVSTNSQNETTGNWYKDFILSDFDSCSNLIAETSFKITAGLENGYLNLIIDLYDDVNSEIPFSSNYSEPGSVDVGSGFFRIRTKAICVPSETAKFRVRLLVKSESNTTVYFDDLKVDLYD